jgi:GTPase SAR1 family protein
MIGESGTGKTCIVARYDKDVFSPGGKATTGGALTSKTEIVQLPGGGES